MLVLMLAVLFAPSGSNGARACAAAPQGEPTLIVAVVDPLGLPIEDATIDVRSRAGHAFARSVVDGNMRDRAKAYFTLPSGEYRVHAGRPGFHPQERKVTLQPGCLDGLMVVLPIQVLQ